MRTSSPNATVLSFSTRLPVAGSALGDPSDPAERVARLRLTTRITSLTLTLAITLAVTVGLAPSLLAGDVAMSAAGWATGLGVIGVVTVLEWHETRAQMRAAEPLHAPVRVLRPRLAATLAGPQRTAVAGIAAGGAVLVVLVSLMSANLTAFAYAAGFALRGLALEALIAWCERRDGRRYLWRVDAPEDDDLLHATPERWRAVRSGDA